MSLPPLGQTVFNFSDFFLLGIKQFKINCAQAIIPSGAEGSVQVFGRSFDSLRSLRMTVRLGSGTAS